VKRLPFLLVGLALLAGLSLFRAAEPYPVREFREAYFDWLQRLAPREFTPLPVRVVDLDEASLAALGQWPWPRHRLALLLDRLVAFGAATVVFDVLFPEPDRLSPSLLAEDPVVAALLARGAIDPEFAAADNDATFAAAMQGRAVVLGIAETAEGGRVPGKAGLVQIGADPAAGLPVANATTALVPVLREAATGIGSVSTSPWGSAAIIRTVPLLWQSGDGAIPGLAVEALRVAQGESSLVLFGAPEVPGVIESVRVGAFEVPTTPDGQIWLRARRDDPRLYIPARDLLAGAPDPALRERIEGHIVMVGTSAAGLLDIRTTPLGENVPGVSIHAQVIEQILLGDFLRRSDFTEGLEIAAFALLGLVVVGVMSVAGPLVSMAAGGVAGALVLGGSWLAFTREGVLFDATFPLVGGMIAFAALAGFQFVVADREKRVIRRSFSHYVAPAVLEQIERAGHRLELGGETRVVTVMFCDIRNFTGLSETMPAHDLVTLLNGFFGGLAAEIIAEEGTIDKFVGDSIMAFWNAPVETTDHRLRACRAALKMRGALAAHNAGEAIRGSAPVAIGIGIASGEACVGNIGARNRFNYSAIGDTVNVAARVEAECRPIGYDILVTAAVAEGAAELAFLPAGSPALKGKTERTAAFALVGDAALAASPDFAALKVEHARLIDGLRAGEMDPARIAACKALAAGIEPGLAGFYDRLPQRADDFRAPSAAPRPAAAAGA
jgi:adenylate cyclase